MGIKKGVDNKNTKELKNYTCWLIWVVSVKLRFLISFKLEIIYYQSSKGNKFLILSK